MSLVLTDAGEKLEITTTAVTIPFTVHYADYVGATPVFTPGVVSGDTIVGTKDLLVAPGSGQRVVRTITVHNDSGGVDTITVQLDDGGTNYTIVKVALADGYTLGYDEDGWKVLDDTGGIQTTLVGGTTQHNILSTAHADAATDAVTQGSIIAGNATPKWDELVIGTAHQVLKVNVGGTDPAWTSFDWDDLAAAAAADMVHTHGSAVEGGAALGPLNSVTMAEDAWVGIGAAVERIVFNGGDDAVAVMGAYLGIGTTVPGGTLDVVGEIRITADDVFVADVAQLLTHAISGLVISGHPGTSYDIEIVEGSGNALFANPVGTNDVTLVGGGGRVGVNCAPAHLVEIDGDSTVAGITFHVFRNVASGSTDNMVALINQQNAGDDQDALQVRQAGSGAALHVHSGDLKVASLAGVGVRNVSADQFGNLVIA